MKFKAVEFKKMELSLNKANLLIFTFACLPFLPTLLNGFVLDDIAHISENYQLRSLSYFKDVFFQATFPGNLYRPVVDSTYALTYHFFSSSAWAYHFVNILLHIFVCAALFSFLRKVTSYQAAFWGSLLFAVHPVHSEVVANISYRTESISALFILLTLNASLTRRSAWRVFIFSSLAFFSKESSLCLLLLLPLSHYFFSHPLKIRLLARAIVPVIGAALLYLVSRILVLGSLTALDYQIPEIDNVLVSLSTRERIEAGFILLGRYMFISLTGLELSPDYSLNKIVPGELSFISFEFVIALIALLLAVYGLRRKTNVSFFALWFFLSFSITSNILLPIGTIFADRLAYLPSVGAIGLLVEAVKQKDWRARWWIIAAVFIALSLRSTYLGAQWRDKRSFSLYAYKVAPESAKAKVWYAVEKIKEEKVEKAIAELNQASMIYPSSPHIYYWRAAAYEKLGKEERAVRDLKRALLFNPQHSDSNNFLARIYINNNQTDKAISLLLLALNFNNTDIRAKIALIAALTKKGNLAQARDYREEIKSLAAQNREFIYYSEQLDRAIRTEDVKGRKY